MRKPGESEDEDDARPGGRALQRLQQFEQARGLEETEVMADDVEEPLGEDESAGECGEDEGDKPS
jgi:hypothetical protein